MNQKGEVTLFSCLLILALTTIVLLSALELRRSYQLLERRTHLFLCVKEAKGELHDFLAFMGRTNWAIKNLNRASVVLIFIPGAQGLSLKAQKLKKYLQYTQEARVLAYIKTTGELRSKKHCPVDPRMLITPLLLGSRILKRDSAGAAILRKTEWNYGFFLRPYFIGLKVDASQWEKVNPKLSYVTEEKGAKLSSHLSSL